MFHVPDFIDGRATRAHVSMITPTDVYKKQDRE